MINIFLRNLQIAIVQRIKLSRDLQTANIYMICWFPGIAIFHPFLCMRIICYTVRYARIFNHLLSTTYWFT